MRTLSSAPIVSGLEGFHCMYMWVFAITSHSHECDSSTCCLQLAVKLKNLGAYEISLGDTIGVGTPGEDFNVLRVIFIGS